MLSTVKSNAYWFLNSHVTIAVSGADNSDGISILLHRVPFGDAPPLHVHHREDEIFHLLEGKIRYRLGERDVVARTGETVFAPRGIPHGFRVLSPEGARVLTITRGGFESMVREAARPADHGGLPDQVEPTPEMQARLGAICLSHDIELIGPPIA